MRANYNHSYQLDYDDQQLSKLRTYVVSLVMIVGAAGVGSFAPDNWIRSISFHADNAMAYVQNSACSVK